METRYLPQLFARFPTISVGLPNLPVASIVADSRQVVEGSLFVACKGDAVDGHQYIGDAIQRGACAVVGEKERSDLLLAEDRVPYVRVVNTRRALAELSAAYYGYPAHRLTVIGVTGTDGKTTTTSLIFQILQAAGIRAGMISTVSAVIGSQTLDTGFHVTTPDAPEIQRYLAQMVDADLTHVVLEATSHGLAQHRVDECEFDVAVITNITHEHLDYHGSYDGYRAAKARLFEMLAETPVKPQGNPRLAVLNLDDRSYPYLFDLTKGLREVRVAAYGLNQGGEAWAEDIQYTGRGLGFDACIQDSIIPITSQLVGEYNVSNILAAALATRTGFGIPLDAVRDGVAGLPGVPGRMEWIDLGQDFMAIVDFAHTPNALQRTLETAKQLVRGGRVIAVFGSAGLRDRQKRRLMAETSARLADLTILTAEDPRTESLESILEEMAEGARSQGGIEGLTFWRVPDRGNSIRFAMKLARAGDVVLACGKGHEQSMCFGVIEYAWDDRTAMRAALSELLGKPGPAMPILPTS